MRFSLRSVFTAIALSCSVPAVASAQVVTDASQIQPGYYRVEPQHTQVSFTVLHFGFSVFEGLFSGASGVLRLDPRQPEASSLSVSVPVSSVLTTNSKLMEELKGSEWLAAGQFPKAEFVSVSVKQTGPNDALVSGNLTLHGITHPETLRVHFLGAGVNMLDKKYTVGFDATATIRRSDFGVRMFIPYVSDEVELRIAAAFERQDVAVPAGSDDR
ncbi:polyisoprenoid-binding protein [Parasaccharibacter sp. TMW2.1882]|uniref:Polyisoprenoid-binding protein n=1 Tax=Parasaccharibacter apium TaxID=1510841 RepID=A0A7U7J138_9PROT|nr:MULTISPECIES: YceI family protein [Acetobacteraceae]MCL1562744.1 polyisoprenoid-binding protein [Parasaccharibacter sp. TMW 2.1886]MUG79486.1 polyisoprenoid-binding protein [Bombella sp. ESL0380]QGT75145.1 polyisoprenoid-binding protein [Bombella sp. ESL0368]MCK8636779.1 polyisoprenoid-binding protein [Parasaccharibacter sp. TMW2.1885]MCL1496109.1 polyisoprenoid-binding protein [Parasaccharibacter sp. TMW2.1882]